MGTNTTGGRKETSLTTFEKFTGIDTQDLLCNSDDLVIARRRRNAKRRLVKVDLPELTRILVAEEERRRAPVYKSGELVPRIWPLGRYEDGWLTTPNIVKSQDVLRALMYSHAAEIPDPLLGAFTSPPSSFSLKRRIIIALRLLQKLKPLTDAGVVTIGPRAAMDWDFRGASAETKVASRELLVAAMQTARGRAAVLKALGITTQDVKNFLYMSRHRFSKDDRSALIDLAGSDADAPQITTMRIRIINEAMSSDLQTAELAGLLKLMIDDLLSSMARSHAGLWLPNSFLIDIIAGAHETVTARADQVLTWLTELPSADLSDINIRDLISIRLNSDAFTGWRDALNSSYEDLQLKIALGLMDEAGESAAEVLQSCAEQVLSLLRRDAGHLWTGALRSLTVGLAAAVPGAIAAGTGGAVAVGSAGVAAGVAVDAGWDVLGSPRRRRPAQAIIRHAAALGTAIRESSPRGYIDRGK